MRQIPGSSVSLESLRSACRRMGGWVLGLGVVVGVLGCSTLPEDRANRLSPNVSAQAYPAAFKASQAVLRDAGFTVDRRDFRFGRVTSLPKGSPTVFEPWKPDNTYADQAWSSTLGDQRRTVTVSFTPAPAPGSSSSSPGNSSASAENQSPQASETLGITGISGTTTAPTDTYTVEVEVLLERFQVPQRRMNGSTNGLVFADLSEVPEELQARGVVGRYWQPVGRDVHLEQRLLQEVLARVQDPNDQP